MDLLGICDGRIGIVPDAPIQQVQRVGTDLQAFTFGNDELFRKRYVFVLERHYHPPGFVGGPTGYHKGVTVYEFR